MKKIEKKLSLKKELIANLNKSQLGDIKGGDGDSKTLSTFTPTLCTTSIYCLSRPSNGNTADC